MTPSYGRRIAPFGNPRINGRMRLPADYRGLPRPSSPAIAKASIMRPNSLPAISQRRARHGLAFSCLDFAAGTRDFARPADKTSFILPSMYARIAKEHAEIPVGHFPLIMVGAPGLGPGTSSLSEKRSNQLSYAPTPK